MQLFIRDISGTSHAVSVSDASELLNAAEACTGVSSSQARISYATRDITRALINTNASLDDLGLRNDATLDISARLRGGAPKKRCAFMTLKHQPASASTSAASIAAAGNAAATSDSAAAIADNTSSSNVSTSTSTAIDVTSSDVASTSTEASSISTPAAVPASAPTEPIYERCSSAALRMVGDCPRCDKSHCSAHRLPENHNCPALAGFRKQAFEENRAKLEKEATHASKISAF